MPVHKSQPTAFRSRTTNPAPMTVTTAQLKLQASLIEAMTGLVDLVARLRCAVVAQGCPSPAQHDALRRVAQLHPRGTRFARPHEGLQRGGHADLEDLLPPGCLRVIVQVHPGDEGRGEDQHAGK